MPLVYGNSPAVTLPNTARDALAKELTVTVRKSEQLPMAPPSQSTTWIYCHKLPPGHVYYGEQLGGTEVISLEINTFWGYTDEVELVDSRFTRSDKNASWSPPGDHCGLWSCAVPAVNCRGAAEPSVATSQRALMPNSSALRSDVRV